MSESIVANNTSKGGVSGLLGNAQFRNFFIGSAVSQLGDIYFVVALPWLVLQMTGSGAALGSVLMTVAIPRAVLLLLGGTISDRFSARNILIVVNSALTICVLLVALLAWQHALFIWEIYVVAFCYGVTDAFAFPALKALLPSFVAAEQIQTANSLFMSMAQICLLVGSAVAGVLIGKWGLVPGFFIDAATFPFLILGLLTIRVRAPIQSSKQSFWQSTLEGLQYVKASAKVRSLIILFGCVSLCMAGATQIGLVAIANFRFHSSGDFGIMLMGASIGSLLGAVLAGSWRHNRPVDLMVLYASAIVAVLVGALALQTPLWAVMVILIVLGMISGYINVDSVSWLQKVIKPDMLGRTMSVLTLVSMGVTPISLVFSGFLLQFGTQVLFGVVGGVLFVVTVVIGLGGIVTKVAAE